MDRGSRGKGWALREAFKVSKGDLVSFIDGDGDCCARMLLRLLPFAEDFPVVVGSKRITKSPLRRKIMTHVTRWWFRLLFGVKVDTQTGIKIFHREALEKLENGWACDDFLFDLEIIARLQKLNVKMVEVPVEVEIKRQVSLKTIFLIAWGSICLRLNLLLKKE